ncbi:hypothetical protein AGMMS49975_10190 [Clostridia bacterium]|nr:hypothetical protein AGMMS49975_10190 [Clostridia bacterium]
MEKSVTLRDMIKSFAPEPLKEADFAGFYCADTIESRTGSKETSPMDNLFDTCRYAEGRKAYLLMGHRGCGKSTELNRLKQRLEGDGYKVAVVSCNTEINLMNVEYCDLLILIAQSLFKIAVEIGCDIDKNVIKRILSFWDEKDSETIFLKESNLEIQSEASFGTGGLFGNILTLFSGITGDLKNSSSKREMVRERVIKNASEWTADVKYAADTIAVKQSFKHPIVIMEDLDKLNPADALRIFKGNAATLSQLGFPVIYTFPIAAFYSPEVGEFSSYFEFETLPMIKIINIDGTPYDKGRDIIKDIVKRRTDIGLIDENALDLLIEKTGGSLRDLFGRIIKASLQAPRRGADKIELKDAESVLTQLSSELTRRIDSKYYELLQKIYMSEKERSQIEETGLLLDMLQANVILEYNGERWHDVHPLVADFLVKIGLVSRR